MACLNRDAEVIAAHFGLRYRAVEADRANATSRYGICYSDGTIRIRLRHATTGRPLKYSSLVNTLCHELAHLRHFDHGPRFKAFYLHLLAFARRRGLYRPGPAGRRPASPAPGAFPGYARPLAASAAREVRPGAAARRPDGGRTPRAPEHPRGGVQLDLFG